MHQMCVHTKETNLSSNPYTKKETKYNKSFISWLMSYIVFTMVSDL